MKIEAKTRLTAAPIYDDYLRGPCTIVFEDGTTKQFRDANKADSAMFSLKGYKRHFRVGQYSVSIGPKNMAVAKVYADGGVGDYFGPGVDVASRLNEDNKAGFIAWQESQQEHAEDAIAEASRLKHPSLGELKAAAHQVFLAVSKNLKLAESK